MFRELTESIGGVVLETVGRASSRLQERKSLPADLLESDDAFLAVFDAPGVAASDVQVRFERDVLRVRADRFREFHEGYEMRFPGRGTSLTGDVALPDGASVAPERASATVTRDGTLRVTVPKTDEDRIEITEEEPARGDEAVDRTGAGESDRTGDVDRDVIGEERTGGEWSDDVTTDRELDSTETDDDRRAGDSRSADDRDEH